MPKLVKSLLLTAFFIFIAGNIAVAGGLSTRFVEVKLKDLEPGKAYSVKEVTGKALVVNNATESRTVDIAIEPEKPVDYSLVPGYEPIPDLSWVAIEKDYFKEVGPGKSAETDILISIPKDKECWGRKYQVYIYSHTAGKETFRMGIMSRILIEIKEVPTKRKIRLDKRGGK